MVEQVIWTKGPALKLLIFVVLHVVKQHIETICCICVYLFVKHMWFFYDIYIFTSVLKSNIVFPWLVKLKCGDNIEVKYVIYVLKLT